MALKSVEIGLKLALKLFAPTHSVLADQVLQDNNSGFKTSRRPPELSSLPDFMSLAIPYTTLASPA